MDYTNLKGITGFLFLILMLGLAPMNSHASPGVSSPSPADRGLAALLKTHVMKLAGEIGERNVWQEKNLAAAASYIEETLAGLGYDVRRQEYRAEGRTVANLEVELRGKSRPEDIIVIGAHYDTVRGCPGANDNGSGVAALLEMARSLAAAPSERTLRLVFFVNEEPPFFLTDKMGSRVYAQAARKRGEKIIAMLSLETIGYYSDQAGSQNYPFPFSFFYPDTANFIGFVSNIKSRRLLRRTLSLFRRHSTFPAEGVTAPGWMTGIGWSDHWSFWRAGYPAIMITDTALFRYRQYHTPADIPAELDYDRMALVVAGLTAAVLELSAEGTE